MSDDKFRSSKNQGPRINEQIRVPEVRLISDDVEENFGVVTIDRARRISQEYGLDLVEVSPTAKPPVVKLIDFGKYKYQQQKKLSEAKKKQVVVNIKEIKIRPNIDTHDLQVKLKKAYEFLDDGDKVKMLMQFRGREMAHKEIGIQRFNDIVKMVVEYGAIIEQPSKLMGNRIFVMLAPTVKKK